MDLFSFNNVFKMYYIYIIYSKSFDVYYKGITLNLIKRLHEHNENLSDYTSGKGPWELVYCEKSDSKRQVLIREKQMKRLNRKSIEKLIDSNK